ncbi:MAG: hypothetical protein UR39_C0010G0004 [Candidatus Woesebacteria bacterium GW2011_GWA1_33_30]|uniref:Uncharacterized protein n=1 Tax=Candidatus Woesebacteria bacterium GW2011_GWA2_33_28 TaxID=1618561 RepID=A0A0F9ZQ98_9BACT|nr:MAG: hypothetical protein UR38_C0010G0004 [Candidatus Woesebacteria bacterium GW2011_GWA2_33_28]KKP47262.1 MAG: hypothetical protein UR39_C0010G0004 [Candidatus Woesebacteria bacterium GW2011_GWA1_33_30]KKP51446.1 MAG: hypothetical protein UR44_C0010G0004 [Candidatus Woesebacteria bacterium GW2011_GWB1_33_38]KKP56918.1 MAG: hypothetical protein UR48_C0026G0001 [Microgenomates group bacterium GW2011_GWD1_33_9]
MSKSAKIKAKIYYDDWRKEKTYSPALKKNINITLKGWRHITGDDQYKKRVFNDVYRRLKLLPSAKFIIKKSSTIQSVRVKNSIKYFALEAVVPVKINKSKTLRIVKVIIQEDKIGNLVFLSVMDKKS